MNMLPMLMATFLAGLSTLRKRQPIISQHPNTTGESSAPKTKLGKNRANMRYAYQTPGCQWHGEADEKETVMYEYVPRATSLSG